MSGSEVEHQLANTRMFNFITTTMKLHSRYPFQSGLPA